MSLHLHPNPFFSYSCLTLSLILLQLPANGQFLDVQLFNNGTHCDGILEVDLQIKTSFMSQGVVKIGTSSLLFNFDPQALEIVDYIPVEFDKNTSEKAKLAKWLPQQYTVNSTYGLFNLSLVKKNGGENNYELTQADWVTIGKIVYRFKNDFVGSSTTIQTNLDHSYFSNLTGESVGLSSIPQLQLQKPNIQRSPNFELTATQSWCGNKNGSITITFNKKASVSHMSFSLDGGRTFQPEVSIFGGEVTYDGLKAGDYDVLARWGDGDCLIPLEKVIIEKMGPEAPQAKFKTIASTCGLSNGGITFTFEATDQFSGIEFSLDGGKTYQPTVPIQQGTVTYEAQKSGAYDLWARWPNGECPVLLGTANINNNQGLPPVVTVLPQDAICSYENGQLTFQFQPTEGRTHIEFSLDDGQTFQSKVKLENQTITYDNLEVGTYSVWARWGNGECPLHLGVYDIQNQFGQGPIVAMEKTDASCGLNNGSITLSFSEVAGQSHYLFCLDGSQTYGAPMALTNKEIIYEDLAPGEYDVWARWDNLECPTSLGIITIENQLGHNPVVKMDKTDATCGLENGSITFQFSSTPDRTKIEFSLDGGQSFKRSVALANQLVTYDDLAPGTYPLAARWGNNECPIDLGEITIENLYGQAPSVNVKKKDASCGYDNGSLTFEFGTSNQHTHLQLSIDGGQAYSSPIQIKDQPYIWEGLTPDTYEVWAQWSNETCPVYIGTYTVNNKNGQPPVVTVIPQNANCGLDNGQFTFTFDPTDDRTKIEFSLDGNTSYKKSVLLSDGEVTYGDLPIGSYELWARWGDNDCPVSLGTFLIDHEGGEGPIGSIEKQDASCGSDNGQLLVFFDPIANQENILLSIDNGETYTDPIPLSNNSYVFDQLPVGDYAIWAKWEDGSCPVSMGQSSIKNQHGLPPTATVTKTDASCGAPDGVLTFQFELTAGRSKIEFSLDGGVTYLKPVQLKNQLVSYEELPADTYEVWVRWGNDECPVSLGEFQIGSVDCTANLTAPHSSNESPYRQNIQTPAVTTLEARHSGNPPNNVKVEESLKVSQNFPNPFKRSTTIDFDLSEPGLVHFEVINLNGQGYFILKTIMSAAPIL